MESRTKKGTELIQKMICWYVGAFESSFQGRQMQGHISTVKIVGREINPRVMNDNHLKMNFS